MIPSPVNVVVQINVYRQRNDESEETLIATIYHKENLGYYLGEHVEEGVSLRLDIQSERMETYVEREIH